MSYITELELSHFTHFIIIWFKQLSILQRGCFFFPLHIIICVFPTQVVACYRHLASCVGGCTDSLKLRDELRQTREKAQKLAMAICRHLTSHLRDKSLPQEQRKEMELLWVAFSSSLELLHVDMCKVFNMGDIFSLANTDTFVQTGLQGKLQLLQPYCSSLHKHNIIIYLVVSVQTF